MDYFTWGIDPVFISVGFLTIRWYGLMFATAFISSFLLMQWMYKREGYKVEEVDNLLWFVAIGTIVGARLGHCLFYAPEYYFNQPLKIFAIWEGGLASHGGIAGIAVALFLYQRKVKQSFAWFLDRVAVACSLGGVFVRLGNFFNSEIVGIPTTVPWAIVFKRIDLLPRHPVQLYEAITYAFIFLCLLLIYKYIAEKLRPGMIFSISWVAIFTARFFLEFVKTKQADYSTDLLLSTGQLLSIPFFLAGLLFIVFSIFKKRTLL